MDDQEAQSIIDSQPGANIHERELNAIRQLYSEEDLATTFFYQTLTRLHEHYTDTSRHRRENITVNDLKRALRNFADTQERAEAKRLIKIESAKVTVRTNRSQALERYIQQQQMNVQA